MTGDATAAAGSINYSVESLLLPPGAHEEGLAVGVDRQGERIVSWGTRTGLDESPARSLPVLHRDCIACALALPAASISELSKLTAARAEVTMGVGTMGDLARTFLTVKAGSKTSMPHPDLLVVAGDQPESWLPALKRLEAGGALVALMSRDAAPCEFDFYPSVHSRSLRLVLIPWYLPPMDLRADFMLWHDAAAGVSQRASDDGWQWLTQLDSSGRDPHRRET